MENRDSGLQKVLCVKLQKFHVMKFDTPNEQNCCEKGNGASYRNCKAIILEKLQRKQQTLKSKLISLMR